LNGVAMDRRNTSQFQERVAVGETLTAREEGFRLWLGVCELVIGIR
jgi:hypothetical protein